VGGLSLKDLYDVQEKPCERSPTCLVLSITDHEPNVGGYHNWVLSIPMSEGKPSAVKFDYLNVYI